jgi:gliding motility-associated-like protein
LVNAKGCDSILTLNLTVNPKTFGTINQSICQGSSFLFNGINRTVSGAYLDTLVNAKGCDSILTLNLTVNPKTFGTINQSICQGTSFLFNGINRIISGTYLDTLLNIKGCDSILTLNLTVNTSTFGTINQTICQGQSFLGRTTSGTYIDTLTGANSKGCDSIRTLILIVNSKTFGSINQTICEGSSFLGRSTSGTYIDTLIGANAKGCDSILTLNLTVNPKTYRTINQTICQGSSFLFNGINQTIAGTYLDTLINAKGCDSILTLNLTINPKTFGTINQTICEGNSFLFNGINRTVSGAYLDTLVNAKGCDSILTLNLTVNPKTFGTINHNICQGSSFLFNGINRTVSGAYIDTLVNIKGCDSIITLNLTVNPKTFGTINQTICQGQSFLGKTSTGTYIDTLLGANANGCDSIRTLILIVNTTTYSNFNQTICEGESFFNRIKSGFYSDTFVNALGCDSVRNLFLTVNPVSKTIINKTICEGDIFIGKSNTGRYLDTFKNRFGCDSIREINLWVTSVNRKTLNYSICDGESFRGRTKTGIFIDTIKNSLGCDSIIETVDLYVRPNIDSSFKVKICDGRSYRGKTTAGNYVDSFVNDYGCISIYRYELSLKVRSYNNEIKTICNDQKYKGYTKSGIYSDTFINQYGCDSIITLTLFVKPNFITQKLKDTTIKKGDSILLQAQKGFLYYTWNTKTTRPEIMVSEAGKYKVTIMNQDGCIAYDSCNVFMIPKDTSNSDTSIIDSIDGYAECPNIFTPNDDFKNDLFRPNFYGEVEVIRLMVYSRLGEKMFEGHGNFSAWDGYYKGEKCEPGVYIYIMEFKSKKGNHFVKGSITLLR